MAALSGIALLTAVLPAQAQPADTGPAAPLACEIGGPHTDFAGTNIRMRSTPGGGRVLGHAHQGDCAYWYFTDSGPSVRCPDGSTTVAWHNVLNKRTKVRGYVSACFFRK
ncbi:hypothetical protein [Streptoalloteichus hindustanus]|uniref:hypothetical protein n=1 Tax=Streptoalloteichus hindustanus TaxID=2017 RepID=UPI0011615292|nr:hypothetical protein [Streptoalloteichus hindustanus]